MVATREQVVSLWQSLTGARLNPAGVAAFVARSDVAELAKLPLEHLDAVGQQLQAEHPRQQLRFSEWLEFATLSTAPGVDQIIEFFNQLAGDILIGSRDELSPGDGVAIRELRRYSLEVRSAAGRSLLGQGVPFYLASWADECHAIQRLRDGLESDGKSVGSKKPDQKPKRPKVMGPKKWRGGIDYEQLENDADEVIHDLEISIADKARGCAHCGMVSHTTRTCPYH